MNYGVDVHQLIWFESCKYNFYFWNQFLILVYSNLQKSRKLETEIVPQIWWITKSPPKRIKSPPGELYNRLYIFYIF